MLEQYYSIQNLCDRFGVTRDIIYKWMRAERIEYVVIGGHRRFSQSAVDTFIASGRARANEAAGQNVSLAGQ